MKKALLRKYTLRLKDLNDRKSKLDKILYNIVFDTLEIIDSKTKVYKEASAKMYERKFIESAEILMATGKLPDAESAEAKIEHFKEQTEQWIEDFSSDSENDDIKSILEAVRSGDFLKAQKLLNPNLKVDQIGKSGFERFAGHIKKYFLFYLLIIAPIIYASFYVSNEMILAVRSTGWPNTQGTIINSFVKEYERTSGTHRSVHSDLESYTTETYYKPIIIYSYEVDGQSYENNKIAFGSDDSSTDRKNAVSIVKEKPAGLILDVFYDPGKPERSTLGTGLNSDIYIFIVLLVSYTGLLFYFFFRKPKKRSGKR
jgi:hypothetical protein